MLLWALNLPPTADVLVFQNHSNWCLANHSSLCLAQMPHVRRLFCADLMAYVEFQRNYRSVEREAAAKAGPPVNARR